MKKAHLTAAGAAGAVLSLLVGDATLAQDAVSTAPDSNKVLFENERVRVYELTSPPGEKLVMHSHPAHVVYFPASGKAKLTTADGKASELDMKAGDVRWSEPVTHTVENTGTTPLRAVIVELKDGAK